MWVCVYIFVVECICVRGRHMQVCAGSQMSTLSAVPLVPSTLASPKLANLTTTAGQQSPETHLSLPSEGWDCKPITQSQGFKKKVAPEGPTRSHAYSTSIVLTEPFPTLHLAFDCGHFFRTFFLVSLEDSNRFLPFSLPWKSHLKSANASTLKVPWLEERATTDHLEF